MKKLILLAAAITISTSALADEMRTVLVQGTNTICSNDGQPVAKDSNLQVSIPESSLQGTGWSPKRYALARDVQVTIGKRKCTLPKWDESSGKGTALEKVVVQIFCREKSALKFGISDGSFLSEDLYGENGERKLCGGKDFMFKRLSSSDLELENDQYVVDDIQPVYYSDRPVQFSGTIEPKTRVNYFISPDETLYKVPYVRGLYESNNGSAKN